MRGTILTSPDGVTWTRQESGTPNNLDGIAYGSGSFVAVGMNGTIVQAGTVQASAMPSAPARALPPEWVIVALGCAIAAGLLAVYACRRINRRNVPGDSVRGEDEASMKRNLAIVVALAAAAVFVAGCGSKAVQNGQKGLPAPVLSAVPFSQLQAPALDTVDFISDTVGYVGGQGLILKSADGGQTWTKLYASTDNVVSVDAVDAVNVWAATSDYLLRSTDGRSFQRVDPAINAGQNGKGISAIDFVSGDQGFILANGVIWRLTNGADVQRATPPGRVDSLSFVDQNHGFAAGANVVYKTSDGGRTWARIFTAPVATPNGQDAWRAMIRAGSATNAWLLVYGGDEGMSQMAYVVFHTTDGAGFTPVMDEGYFSVDYPTIHLGNNQNIGIQPGTIYGSRRPGRLLHGLGCCAVAADPHGGQREEFHQFRHRSAYRYLAGLRHAGRDQFCRRHARLAGGKQQNGQGIILDTTDGATFKAVP